MKAIKRFFANCVSAGPSDKEIHEAHMRSGYVPNASKGDFLMPPDHEMTPEEVEAYKSECVSESTKEDHDKCQLDIINPAYLEDLADVLTDGEETYGLNNWRGLHFSRIIASMLRHMTAIQKGEDIDPDSGHPHAAHIAANAMFLHWWQANGFVKGKQDDRRWVGI